MFEGQLLERDDELSAIDALLGSAALGEGGAIVVEGPPGIGKTALLRAAEHLALGREIDVLRARASDWEQSFAFGVCLQLFRGVLGEDRGLLTGVSAPARALLAGEQAAVASPGEGLLGFILLGLLTLCENLAARRPLLLLVDDVHWADQPSQQFLAFLARRLHGIRIAVLVGLRTGDPISAGPLVEALRESAAGPLLRPKPLSEQAVISLVRGVVSDADEQTGRWCAEVTAGNPFYVACVTRALAEGASVPGEEGSQLSRQEIAESVLVRTGRLGADARRLVEAVAVVGDDQPLAVAAELAGLPLDRARTAADQLAAAAILSHADMPAFAHPIVRQAVHGAIPAAARAGEHLRAARLLAGLGADPETVCAQLLDGERSGDPWVVAALGQGAERALARSAPSSAAAYLERALAEPPPESERWQLLFALGTAQSLNQGLSAIPRLRDAVEQAPAGPPRVAVLRVLAATLTGFGRFDEAVAALEQALAEVPSGDRETSLQIEGDLSSIGRYAPSTYQRSVAGVARIAAEQGLRGETPAERLLLANLVGNRLHEEATAQEIRERAEWVLRAGLIAEQTSSCSGVYHAMMPLAIAGGYEVVAEACAEGLADARSRGSMLGLCAMLCIRSHLHWRLGDLEAAEHDAQGALANAEQQGLALPEASLAFLADPLVDAGKTAEIRALLQERGQWDSFPENGFMTNFLLPARARLRLALGDPAGALRDLRELERRTAAWPGADPRVHQLDALIAECLAAVGEREQALRYAEAALERARAWGTPRAIGLALRAHGLVSGGEEGLARLQDAVAALRQDRAPLELSRTLVDLGSAQRRAGKRIECREALREAIELAEACGAAPLAERAHQELVASGGRLRRQAPDSGPEALTPSERRVAEMAAAGATNREIAWQLVISVKTVEMHLGRVYRKLGVTNRHALAQLSLHR